MALPIKRVNLASGQEVEETDGNAIGTLALDALYQTLKAMLGVGWVRLGALDLAGDMEVVLRAPTAVITAEGLAITDADESQAINPAHSTEPRIDLLSIGWEEVVLPGDVEERTFINGDEEEVPGNADTRKTWRPIVTYTVGDHDPEPEPPATPANQVPIYYINVGAGVTALTADDITPVATGAAQMRSVDLAADSWGGVGVLPQNLPYTSPTLLSFQSRGAFTVIAATLTMIAYGTFDPMIQMRPLLLSIEDADSGQIVGRSEQAMFRGEYRTVTVIGILTGPTAGTRNYRLKVTPGIGNGNVHTGLILPTVHNDQTSTVINTIAAVSF